MQALSTIYQIIEMLSNVLVMLIIIQFIIGLLFAFLAGGVVLNVLKEELPEDRQSRFLPFLLGAGGYALLLAI